MEFDFEAQERRLVFELTESTTHDSRAFAEFDLDGNQALDFDEFLAMQPPAIRRRFTTAEIREWFNEADLDGNGHQWREQLDRQADVYSALLYLWEQARAD